MCTGVEPAVIAAAAPAATAAATGLTAAAMPAAAGLTAAELAAAGIGSSMAATPAIAAPAAIEAASALGSAAAGGGITAGSQSLISPVVAEMATGAGAAGTTQAAANTAANAAGTGMSAAGTSGMSSAATPFTPIGSAGGSGGFMVSPSSSFGFAGGYGPGIEGTAANISASAAGTAPSSFLGMTPTQWGQQALLQGGGTALSAIGNMQAQNAQSDAYSRYDGDVAALDAENKARMDAAMAAYSPDALAASKDKYVQDQLGDYDKNRLSMGNMLLAPPSAASAVSDDLNKRLGDVNAYGRKQFESAAGMRSLSDAMVRAGQSMDFAALQNKMNQGTAGLYGQAMQTGYQQAGGKGGALTGAGNLLSGGGNLLLASQLQQGKKPSSILSL
jgi:hypothetical protein